MQNHNTLNAYFRRNVDPIRILPLSALCLIHLTRAANTKSRLSLAECTKRKARKIAPWEIECSLRITCTIRPIRPRPLCFLNEKCIDYRISVPRGHLHEIRKQCVLDLIMV